MSTTPEQFGDLIDKRIAEKAAELIDEQIEILRETFGPGKAVGADAKEAISALEQLRKDLVG